MQISSCILTFSFRRLGWISSSPGDLVIPILSIPSMISPAVTYDWATQYVTSLWCANQRSTLLSGSFPLKCPPFSRWWEWGANTVLSHTPTPCLLKRYFFMPTLRRKKQKRCDFSILILLWIYATCWLSASPTPKTERAKWDVFGRCWQLTPATEVQQRWVLPCPGVVQPRPTGTWAGGTAQPSPLYQRIQLSCYVKYLGFPLSCRRCLCLALIPAPEHRTNEM